ncbi:PA14 domain-containing protein [Phlyctochytrium arcticum]|nr:PA14 domain-containing protein [Phlyctochytrium arcticum]
MAPTAEPGIRIDSSNSNALKPGLSSSHLPLPDSQASSPTSTTEHSDRYRRPSIPAVYSRDYSRHSLSHRSRSHSQVSLNSDAASRVSALTLQHGPAADDDDFASGVAYEYFKGDFSSLPDFNTLQPASCGVIKNISIDTTTESTIFDPSLQKARATGVGNFAVRFTAHVKIPHAGTWTFYLASNDGSALFVSGKKVINNDGTHYGLEKEGTLKISEAGYYPITVGFFHKNGKLLEGVRTGAYLGLSYYCPGTGWLPYPADRVAKTPVPETSLFHDPRDENVRRALDSDRPAWEYEENEELRVRNLEEDYRDVSERLITVQRALESERAQTQRLVDQIAQLRLFKHDPLPSSDTANFRNDSDDSSQLHEHQLDVLQQHIEDVDRLKVGYFFALGIHTKLRNQQYNFSLNDAYEKCHAKGKYVDDYPKALKVAVEQARRRSTSPTTSTPKSEPSPS